MAPLPRSACVLTVVLASACGSGVLQPQLVLEALAITRARTTAERRDLHQDYILTAALSLPVSTAGVHAAVPIEASAPGLVEVRMHESEPAVGCDELLRALCTWAQHAEDAAWTMVVTESWVTP